MDAIAPCEWEPLVHGTLSMTLAWFGWFPTHSRGVSQTPVYSECKHGKQHSDVAQTNLVFMIQSVDCRHRKSCYQILKRKANQI